MPNLLSLPQELRDIILERALYSQSAPPFPFSQQPAPEQIYSAYPLLLTNRQLHAETTQILKRLPLECIIDIQVTEDGLIIPTWTFVPNPREKLDVIQVRIWLAQQDPKMAFLEQLDVLLPKVKGGESTLLSLLLEVIRLCTRQATRAPQTNGDVASPDPVPDIAFDLGFQWYPMCVQELKVEFSTPEYLHGQGCQSASSIVAASAPVVPAGCVAQRFYSHTVYGHEKWRTVNKFAFYVDGRDSGTHYSLTGDELTDCGMFGMDDGDVQNLSQFSFGGDWDFGGEL